VTHRDVSVGHLTPGGPPPGSVPRRPPLAQVLGWFPDRAYAILLPAYAGACLVALVLAFVGRVMLIHKTKRA
jgi:hypothetical protein